MRDFGRLVVRFSIFVALFVLISLIIGQGIITSSLLYGFGLFVYGGMGKILLFSIVGFLLFYRERLAGVCVGKYETRNLWYILVSGFLVLGFVFLEKNIDKVSVGFLNAVLIHLLFLGIFVFLLLGIFGVRFIGEFYFKFKRELLWFLIFGVVVYSLMYQVWRLWPYLSFVVTKAVVFLLGLVSDNVYLINAYTPSMDGFAAEIGEACSGIFSIFIFVGIYVFAVLLDWKKVNKFRAFVIFFPAVVGAFLMNIFRVFLLFIVGAYVSRDLALGLYHSYTGMIFFMVYFVVFWVHAWKWIRLDL